MESIGLERAALYDWMLTVNTAIVIPISAVVRSNIGLMASRNGKLESHFSMAQ
jgi:hypothetical protein